MQGVDQTLMGVRDDDLDVAETSLFEPSETVQPALLRLRICYANSENLAVAILVDAGDSHSRWSAGQPRLAGL